MAVIRNYVMRCRTNGIGYVLAVACDHRVPAFNTKSRADVLAAGVPKRSWQRLSAGGRREGTAGLRLGVGRHRREDGRLPLVVDPQELHHR